MARTHPDKMTFLEHLEELHYRLVRPLIYLAGGYGVYYYHNTAWDVVKPDPEPPGMKRFQLLKDTLSALPYWRMEPHNELAVGGPCLAVPGEVYAIYVDDDPLTMNLTGMDSPEKARAEWVDTWSGRRETVELSAAPAPAARPAGPAAEQNQEEQSSKHIAGVYMFEAGWLGRTSVQNVDCPREPVDGLVMLARPHIGIPFAPRTHNSCHDEQFPPARIGRPL